MTEERRDPAEADDERAPGGAERASGGSDHAEPLESLREILVGDDRRRLGALETHVEDLERQVTDREALVAMIAPVLTELIRHKVALVNECSL